MANELALRCSHPRHARGSCNVPIGLWKDGILTVRVRHHGENHEFRLPLASLEGYDVAHPDRELSGRR